MWVASMLDKGIKYRTVTQYIAALKHHWGGMRVGFNALDSMTALQRQLQAAKKTNTLCTRSQSACCHEAIHHF
jgi:hypothetical protein